MNVLISGVNGNMGSAIADQLTSQGKTVFGLYANQELLEKDNRSFLKHTADLMNPDAAEQSVNEMLKATKTIDAAVLTVGGFAMGSIKDTSIDDIHQQIKLNFNTAYNLVKPLLAKMKSGGQLFLIGAKPIFNAQEMKGVVSYGLAKQLVLSLAEIINADRKEHGINCTVLVPSILDTPPNRESMPDMNFDDWVKPEEVAKTVNFYLDNPYIKETVVKLYGEV
jgi:NAD(P)-dependent dehydrogenase (short-subunit alcohol dehydrogenase family)